MFHRSAMYLLFVFKSVRVRASFNALAFFVLIAAAHQVGAATITVINTNDSGAGSLRQAVADANATSADDTINFNIPATDPNCSAGAVCTITLTGGVIITQAAGGNLTVANQTGAGKLVISGNDVNRIFEGAPGANLTLDGLTITRGVAPPTTNGNAFGVVSTFRGTLTITNSVITQNTGGSIILVQAFRAAGILNMNDTTLSNNAGEGIFFTNGVSSGGTMNITNSTISNNTTATAGNAGGIYFFGDRLRITNSTLSGNSGSTAGGIHIGTLGPPDSFVLTNCTITANTGSEGGGGGGINVFRASINLRNTIVSGNTRSGSPSDIRFDGSTGISFGNNLIGTSTTVSGGSGQWLASDKLNQNTPRLAPLANNGGATQTHALLPDSPAINAGNNCVLTANGCGDGNPAVPTDQRGQARVGTVDIGAFEFVPRSPFDYDGDGKSDLAVFRPSNGSWYVLPSRTNAFYGFAFGAGTDQITPADYDGDGKTDVAVYRSGNWYIQRSQLGFTGIAFGAADDIPVPADYDGDGKADLGVFRPSNGTWYLLQSAAGFAGIAFGQNGDKPVAADYDGDGKSDLAVNRSGIWYLQQSQAGFAGIPFGTSADRLVPADYDGDGKADIAVFRPSNGTWYLRQSAAGFAGVAFGAGTDAPVAADYDGDGKADIAVYRGGNWYVQRSSQGFTGILFGAADDKPAPNAYVR